MKREYTVRLAIGFFFVCFLVVLRFSGIERHITLNNIKENRAALQQMVDEHYLRSVVLYMVMYAVLIALSIPSSALLTVTGGFLFGTLAGAFYTNIGATLGALAAFMIFRYFLGSAIQRKYHARLERFNKAVEEQGVYYLIMVHFLAFIPFVLINIFAAFTRISVWTFVWTTAVGILPGALVYSYAGSQLAHIDSMRDILSPPIIVAFVLLALLGFLPVLVSHMRRPYKL